MDIELTINKKQHLAYIPKTLYEILGSKVKATPNRAAVLLFSAKMNIDDVLRSMDIIRADLLHAKELNKKTLKKHKLPAETHGAVKKWLNYMEIQL